MRTAARIRASGRTREGDVAARYGGDEFALLLPESEVETALAVAERLRAAVAEETPAGFRLSASFGLAVLPAHGRTTAQLLRVADGALYRAKQRRRRGCLRALRARPGARLTDRR